MRLELDHVLICVQRDAPEAARLMAFGLQEGRRRTHTGQGTRNVCYFFHNAMLELIWVHEANEAQSPLVRPLRLWERWQWRETGSCPFGLCFRAISDTPAPWPFSTWDYRPPYVPEHTAIAMGQNSHRSSEPLLFAGSGRTRPDAYPEDQQVPLAHRFGGREITSVCVTLLQPPVSPEWHAMQGLGLVEFRQGETYHLELGFDDLQTGQEADFRPLLPLSFRF